MRDEARQTIIESLRAEGKTYAQIAAVFGVSRQTICHAVHRQKADARNAVYQAVKRGIIERPEACSKCGKPGKVEGHHEDYSKPLMVDWLCGECHSAIPVPIKTVKPRKYPASKNSSARAKAWRQTLRTKRGRMNAEIRIVQVATHAANIRQALIEHLLTSFEDWQKADLTCSAYYEAADWFAIQALESESFEGVSI
jgi:ribosomal protein S27AE